MRRKINVQLVSISLIAIVATMLVMLFVFYDLFQTQVQDDLRANAIVLKNTGIWCIIFKSEQSDVKGKTENSVKAGRLCHPHYILIINSREWRWLL